MTRIVVLGLLPQQARILEREFPGVRCMSKERSDGKSLPGLLRGCDLVLLSKWTPHRTQDSVKRAGVPWLFLAGGMTSLRRALEERLGGGREGASSLEPADAIDGSGADPQAPLQRRRHAGRPRSRA